MVAAYCRVSTNHPEQIGSLKIQESYFEAIIRAERYEWGNPGPTRLYEKAGFIKAAEQGEVVVMKKEVKQHRAAGDSHPNFSKRKAKDGTLFAFRFFLILT